MIVGDLAMFILRIEGGVLSSEDRYRLPPWLDGVEDRAKSYVVHLSNVPEGEVDWAGVIDSCQTLKNYLLIEELQTHRGADVVVEEETDYWDETIGWAKAQLTPRNSDGNPDSPQVVVFLASVVDVTVGY